MPVTGAFFTAVPTTDAPFVPKLEDTGGGVVRVTTVQVLPGYEGITYELGGYGLWVQKNDAEKKIRVIGDYATSRIDAVMPSADFTDYLTGISALTYAGTQATNGTKYMVFRVQYTVNEPNSLGTPTPVDKVYAVTIPITVTSSTVDITDSWGNNVGASYSDAAVAASDDILTASLVDSIIADDKSAERIENSIYSYIFLREITIDQEMFNKKAEVLNIQTEKFDLAWTSGVWLDFYDQLDYDNIELYDNQMRHSGPCVTPSGWDVGGHDNRRALVDMHTVNAFLASSMSRIEAFRESKDKLVLATQARQQYSEQPMLGDIESAAELQGAAHRRRDAQKAARRNLAISIIGALLP